VSAAASSSRCPARTRTTTPRPADAPERSC
jgi:hypothetical protein